MTSIHVLVIDVRRSHLCLSYSRESDANFCFCFVFIADFLRIHFIKPITKITFRKKLSKIGPKEMEVGNLYGIVL